MVHSSQSTKKVSLRTQVLESSGIAYRSLWRIAVLTNRSQILTYNMG